MAGVMMALGSYRFSMDTAAYDRLTLEAEYRWPEQERLTTRPAIQFVGPGAEKISLQGVIFPHFRGGLGQMDAMRAEAEKGEALLLTDGRGRVWGRFAITKISETQSAFFDNGAPRKIEFQIELKRYVTDEDEKSPVRVGGDDGGSIGRRAGGAKVADAGLPRSNEVNPATGAPYTAAELSAMA